MKADIEKKKSENIMQMLCSFPRRGSNVDFRLENIFATSQALVWNSFQVSSAFFFTLFTYDRTYLEHTKITKFQYFLILWSLFRMREHHLLNYWGLKFGKQCDFMFYKLQVNNHTDEGSLYRNDQITQY